MISDAEKPAIRDSIIPLLTVHDPIVAISLSQALANIVRTDYPQVWPDVFDSLLGAILNASSSTEALRLTSALYYSSKSIALIDKSVCDAKMIPY